MQKHLVQQLVVTKKKLKAFKSMLLRIIFVIAGLAQLQ